MWIVVVVMVEVSSVDCGENRSAEKGKESEMRKEAEYRKGIGVRWSFVSGAGKESGR